MFIDFGKMGKFLILQFVEGKELKNGDTLM